MHNTTTYRAKFRDLIITVFGKEQVLKWTPEIEMFQYRDSPELWRARPGALTGRFKWEASTPAELARIIESDFVERETNWIEVRPAGALIPRPQPKNVVWIDAKRRA